MLSLLGSILGFGTSFLPKVLAFFEERRDQKHELRLIQAQLEVQERLSELKLKEVQVDSNIREIEAIHKEHAEVTVKGSKWVINLSASVRPVITYLLFLEVGILTGLLAFDEISLETFDKIWTDEYHALLATITAFWWGQRSFVRQPK